MQQTYNEPMIYYVEDDTNIRELALYALRQAGLEAQGFPDARTFQEACAKQVPQLVLLDIMLPGTDGLALLDELRLDPKTRDIPVMMLTAKGTEYDKVIGLDAGADDYLAKPFGMMELVSRCNALLRRASRGSAGSAACGDILECGCIRLSPSAHEAWAGGSLLDLTLKEFELLSYLFRHRGNVLTRDQILQEIWGYEFDGENRTVDVHIRTLRAKLGSCGELIETVRGVGYRISAE